MNLPAPFDLFIEIIDNEETNKKMKGKSKHATLKI